LLKKHVEESECPEAEINPILNFRAA